MSNSITATERELFLGRLDIGTEDVASIENDQLWTVLKNRFSVTESQLIAACDSLPNTSIASPSTLHPDPLIWTSISIEDCQGLYPIKWQSDSISVATDNVFHPSLTILQNRFNLPIHKVIVSSATLQKLWAQLMPTTSEPLTVLHHMINHALSVSASDIHLYKQELNTQVMYRIDGKLIHQQTLADSEERQIVALIKFHAELDIAKINQPQDGRIRHQWQGTSVDIRVSSLPSAFGEDFVLRLFNTHHKKDQLSDLSLTPTSQAALIQMMSNRHGLILVTGPTGSGKTTTLYTILNHLKKDNTKSIITLEDPIENILTGIRQSQINPSAGYTFIQGLRAILRQDPDIIMIGEIRDAETAKIALEAAYTGHLVLSTLHTANCESTLLRLQSFDLDPFLLGHSLKGIISQFLTPKRCEHCHQQGCKNCHDTGFKGRIALHEMLVATTPTSLKTQDDFKDFMSKNTYYPFYQDINQKIEDGKVGQDKCIG